MGPSEPTMDAFKASFRKIYVCHGGASSFDEFGEIFVFSGIKCEIYRKLFIAVACSYAV